MFITFCRSLHAACILQEHPSVMSMSCGSICLQQRKDKWSLGRCHPAMTASICMHLEQTLRQPYGKDVWKETLRSHLPRVAMGGSLMKLAIYASSGWRKPQPQRSSFSFCPASADVFPKSQIVHASVMDLMHRCLLFERLLQYEVRI